jgi:hypothetical protein
VGELDEPQRERFKLEAAARRDDIHLDLVDQPVLGQLAPEHGGGEGGAIYRALQARPQPCHGADVVFVGMGNDQADEVVLTIGDEAGVGHHHLDLGQFAAAEADAAIHRQPFFASCLAPAIQVKVHADFARPAQGQEGQFACF